MAISANLPYNSFSILKTDRHQVSASSLAPWGWIVQVHGKAEKVKCFCIRERLSQRKREAEVLRMSQTQKKGWLTSLSPLQRTSLGIITIAIVIVLGVIYGPHYDVDNTTTGDSPPPTVIVTGLANTLNVNRSVVYQGVTVTVTRVAQAQSFSDDGKSQYGHTKYVLRVYLHVQAPKSQRSALGLDYTGLSHLVLSNGTQMNSSLAQISPDILPGQNEDGFLDFWVNTPLNLSQLAFTLNGNTVAFG